MTARIVRAAILAAGLLTASPYWATARPVAPQAAPAATADAETIDYVVQRGDTLAELAEQYLIRLGDYVRVARLNRVSQPRQLPVGSTLRIPVSLLRTTPSVARVSSFRGAVTIEQAGAAATVGVGLVLREGALISTGGNAFVRLTLADGSHLSLPSRSRVRLVKLRTILLNGATDHSVRLETGRAETGVRPVRAPGGFTLSTPISVSAVRGTEFRASYDEQANRAATEVIEGAVAVTSGDQSMIVSEAQGVTAGGDGLRAAPLLAAPDLLQPDAVQNGETVVFDLAPLPQAARYRARLATDAGMIDAFAESETPTGERRIVFTDVADGAYFVRLSAVSADGVEGLALSYSVLRARNGVGGLGATGGQGRPYLFRWEAEGDGPPQFRFQLRRADSDEPPLIDIADLTEPRISLTDIPAGTFEWRVRITRQQFGRTLETWSDPQQLRVGARP